MNLRRAPIGLVIGLVFDLVSGLVLGGACSSSGSGNPGAAGAGGEKSGAAGSGAGGSALGGASGAAAGQGGSATAGASGTAGAGGAGSDQALCTTACSAFGTCGVTISSTCQSDCVAASATYKDCLSAAGTDCNALALCYLKAVQPADCPGGGGVPSGTATCATTDSCQGTCNTSDAGTSCTCGCVAALDPTLANDLLVINSCAQDKCASTCGPNGTHGAACNTCFQAMCATQRTTCLAH